MKEGLIGAFLFCIPILSSPLAVSASKVPQLPKNDYTVPFEDTSSGRMYVAMDSGIIANEDSMVSRLQTFLEKRKLDMWGDKFSKVALFSDPLYAHPKQTVKKHDLKVWAGHFLAEYDSKKNTVWLYPADPTTHIPGP
ncbi:MAG TPA: hypothetical protein VK465_13920 [Fibrobacteria bacterium]|nr:hypothetical protein [Fibrobacteria bacterium]